MESTEQFEFEWTQMVARFELESEKHSSLLFSLRESWALSYVRGYLLAQMATLAYSKCVDMFLKGIINKQPCLRNFFEQISHARSIQRQAYPDMRSIQTRTCVPIEEHARNILTPFAFGVFKQELMLAMQYAVSEMANGSCLVQHFKKMDGERFVIWIPEGEQIHCSCKEFESSGILCRHALRVFIAKNYFELPEVYFSRRWQKIQYDDQPVQISKDEWFQEFHDLTSTLFTESLVTKERFDLVQRELSKELLRLINEVRSMPANDEVG